MGSIDKESRTADRDYFDLLEGRQGVAHVAVPQSVFVTDIRGGERSSHSSHILDFQKVAAPSNGIVKTVKIEQSNV